MKLTLIMLACLLSGCAAVTARPRVMFTPDEDLIVQLGSKCYRVTAIDYDREYTDKEDLAYGTLVPIACPVTRRAR